MGNQLREPKTEQPNNNMDGQKHCRTSEGVQMRDINTIPSWMINLGQRRGNQETAKWVLGSTKKKQGRNTKSVQN